MQATEPDLKDARDQLTMILSFFPRVDAKLSTVLAIDTAMLAALSASVPPIRQLSPWMAIAPILAAALLAASYIFLYRGGFPDLNGGNSSLVYFKEIAARTESQFVHEYMKHTRESLCTDILAQVWRNSEILTEKYRCLRFAFVCMALGAIPWSVSLATFAMHRAKVQIVVSHS